MKYVFPAKSANWDEKLYERFGRAPGFVLYDDANEELVFIENSECNAGHGAGIQAGQLVVKAGAGVVGANGPIGPKAMEVLNASSIKVIVDLGDISLKEALDKVRS